MGRKACQVRELRRCAGGIQQGGRGNKVQEKRLQGGECFEEAVSRKLWVCELWVGRKIGGLAGILKYFFVGLWK